MSDLSKFSGSKYIYDYRTIPLLCEELAISRYAEETKRKFSPFVGSMNDELFTEWVSRNYISLKLIMASTLLVNTAVRCEEEHLLVTLPYLNYYSMLSACRAFLFTLPDMEWKGMASVVMTHQNIVNATANALRRIDSQAESRWGDRLRLARSQRTLFSYRFPGQGPKLLGSDLISVSETIELARFLAELAQFNTECFETSFRKHCKSRFRILDNDDSLITMNYTVDGIQFFDKDDRYRMRKFMGYLDQPCPLSLLATDGLLDDFFGGWYAEHEEVKFSPDDNINIIFDF